MILIQLLAFTKYKIPYLKWGAKKQKHKLSALVVHRTESIASKESFPNMFSDIIQVTFLP